MSTARPLTAGDAAFLAPRTLAASAACWKGEQVTIVSGPANGTFLVALPSGREIRVSVRDVLRNRPRQPTPRKPEPVAPTVLDGAVQLGLFPEPEHIVNEGDVT